MPRKEVFLVDEKVKKGRAVFSSVFMILLFNMTNLDKKIIR
jgi:hypothetical protein